MSRPSDHENGTYGANAANGTPGAYDTPGGIRPADEPEAPNVYHPQAEPTPEYEAYVDPAAAHGWQNAYDETAELPRVVGGVDGVHEDRGAGGASGFGGGYDYVYEDGYDYADDYDAERGGRRSHRGRHQPAVRPGAWRSRRVAVAAGVAGALSLGALIAGFSLSGSSSEGGAKNKGDRTSTTSGDSVLPGGPSAGASAGTLRSEGAERPRPASPSASASPSDSDDKTDKPSTAPSTTSAAPTPTATTPAPVETDDHPGRGQGNTKKPG
ncbi:hypothetical protein EJ357_29455 [Streptomyces cyaneochromogenes]|uniref:Uncharacterized protein n=1 Tax=Streptomyces cyaneochromogenes TaxID=2496836 RepID=A0A3S9MD09_9ACTN|nr:hypothetical protein [Streptomyces cyaneochromogenes]AZQ37064.1 hypothetical protein EJ357_29455 [Streptomyces cyaneochromogenes]